ncbi:MAG: bifunctional class I SAM-dependent methyltransferase/glycosyltransferase family 2 protein [Myxococcota bacterium]|nr:bifunctional class I SAM-dependent methyltransferase/glycosyltransferase family 2 protein [Myxococcota bacterium]
MPLAERDEKTIEKLREMRDQAAKGKNGNSALRRYYHEQLLRQVRFNVPTGASILDVGCGNGDMLAALSPRRGLGIDFSEENIKLAVQKHPHIEFRVLDAHNLELGEKFDVVLLSNLVGELLDVQEVLRRLRDACHGRTRVIITHYNYMWGPMVKLVELIGIKQKQLEQNWLENEDLENLMELAGIEPVKSNRHLLAPLPLGPVADLINNYVATMPFLGRLCLNELVVGRLKPDTLRKRRDYAVSVIVACKDERGNIEELVRKTPRMGKGTELIFVDGHSKDGTLEEIERCISIVKELNPELDDVRVFTQPGKGKGDAVRMGFDMAKGDILMILDADITVRPEDLPKFYEALVTGQGEFINGSRLVYPMESQAMRFLNMLANHFFGWTFSWLLEQRLTDTLCGTKVLFREDYERIKAGRAFFGDFDPFMDFDLLFGAAKQNLKIREVPIRYRAREYGDIKIDRFRHGLLLLKMSAIGFKRFKLHRQASDD